MLLAVWSSYAAAQGLTEEIFLTELPQVLTASRIATSPLDAPAPVTVIDRETILASGFTEIHDVLRLVPGYLVADWPLGSPVVVNHGLGDAYPNRLLVMVDGRSVVNPASGAVDWQDLPLRLDDVERIEVVRGPNQASYGAGAFQGVIHIITREPADDKCAGLTLARGREGYVDNYACIGRSTARLDWRLSLSSREATNFRDLGVYSHAFQEDIERQTLNGQLVFRRVLDEEWLLGIGLSRGEDWVGSSLDPALYPYRARKQHQLSARLAWHKHYAPGSQLSLDYARFQRSKREGYTLSGAGTSTPVQDDLDAARDALELQQIHAWSNTLQTVWGLGVRRDRAESARLFHGQGTVEVTPWQVFANVDWRFDPSWLLHAGLTLEWHPNTDTLLSPRLALNWSLSPERSVRLSMGQGYRIPTLFETDARVVLRYYGSIPALYGKIVDIGTWAVQDLEPELTRFAEIGYVARYPQQGLVLDTRLFVERHERYIDDRACTVGVDCPYPAPADYLRPPALGPDKADYFYNTGSIRTVGGDLTLDWRHPSLGRVLASHAVTRIRAGSGTDRDTQRTAPRHASSLLWTLPLPAGLQASLGYYRVGDMMWLNGGDVQPSYERVDVKLAKRLGGKGSDDELALTLQNATGTHLEFRKEHTVQRQTFLTLRLAW
ncbi:MAG: TonB-dependent receptor plug domain-containing protein [Thiobacillaceae bacterium]